MKATTKEATKNGTKKAAAAEAPKLTAWQEELLPVALHATGIYRKSFAKLTAKSEPTKGLSKKGQEVQDIINKNEFSGYNAPLARLVSVLLDEPITARDEKGGSWTPTLVSLGAVVKAKEGYNNSRHSYKAGALAMVNNVGTGAETCCAGILSDGSRLASGRSFYAGILNGQFEVEPATDEEVRAFVATLEESKFKTNCPALASAFL